MKVRTFVKQYEQLLALCNVTSDRDKCGNITQYFGSKTNRLIEVLKSYQEGNWPALKNQILKLTWIMILNWTKFIQGLIAIADWLRLKNKISEDDYPVYLWQAIHRKLRHKLEAHLLLGDVSQDMSTPFEADKIILAAEKLLQRDRFDTNQTWSDSEDDSDDDTSSSDSDSSSSDSNELVHKMSRLSLDDPKYALLYLQALRRNLDIKEVPSPEQPKGMNNRVLGTLDPGRHLHPPPITPIPALIPNHGLIMDALVAEYERNVSQSEQIPLVITIKVMMKVMMKDLYGSTQLSGQISYDAIMDDIEDTGKGHKDPKLRMKSEKNK
ncbi:hypothetical protein BDN67DRAFT_984217 [Paxillus ammoniavirescens]|nr:hypothetical protein BDN67DRAFT_984217 [Paxillus ammoniavirescens]